MYRYVEARFGAEEPFGGIAASAFAPTGDLPPFLIAQLLFPYSRGEAFVARLLEVGSGRWTVVDAALRFRPPVSTEQSCIPQAYLEVEQPRRVSVRGPVAALGAGWRPALRATLGEWLTERLLARAGGTGFGERRRGLGRRPLRAARARRGARAGRALDLGHARATRTSSPRRCAPGATRGCRTRRRPGRDAWRTPDGAAALHRADGAVTLVLAPDLGACARAPRAPTSLRRVRGR